MESLSNPHKRIKYDHRSRPTAGTAQSTTTTVLSKLFRTVAAWSNDHTSICIFDPLCLPSFGWRILHRPSPLTSLPACLSSVRKPLSVLPDYWVPRPSTSSPGVQSPSTHSSTSSSRTPFLNPGIPARAMTSAAQQERRKERKWDLLLANAKGESVPVETRKRKLEVSTGVGRVFLASTSTIVPYMKKVPMGDLQVRLLRASACPIDDSASCADPFLNIAILSLSLSLSPVHRERRRSRREIWREWQS